MIKLYTLLHDFLEFSLVFRQVFAISRFLHDSPILLLGFKFEFKSIVEETQNAKNSVKNSVLGYFFDIFFA